jgi:hypothetical protein
LVWQRALPLLRIEIAFITPFGHYQFTVMPFGMINFGATFVRMMDKVLEGFDEFADSFIDDIGIFLLRIEILLSGVQHETPMYR